MGLARRKEVVDVTEIGTIQNYLGILSDDHQHLSSKGLAAATGLGTSQLEKITGISRPQFYRKSNLQLNLGSKLMKRMVRLVLATDFAYELLGSDKARTKTWLMSPNTLIFGDSPFEVCMRGEGEKLVEWLEERCQKIVT